MTLAMTYVILATDYLRCRLPCCGWRGREDWGWGLRDDKIKYKKNLARRAVRMKNWKQVVRFNMAQQCWVVGVWRLRHGTSKSAKEWPCSSGRHEQMPLCPTCSSYTGLSFWLCSSWFIPHILKRAKSNFKEPWKPLAAFHHLKYSLVGL